MSTPIIASSQPAALHIASVALFVRPEQLARIQQRLVTDYRAEIHASESTGKLVAVLESEHERAIANAIDQLNNTAGVIHASLVYHEIISGEDL
ncbi:chaperone NapD [Gilvimarinus xylanilyticus]|uniref:Chaperone NapD n=1 Tax=Gilvimarinus xylanilyticus TaxID=2944139 RepID=A0A9X2KU87_9GAMM|nr:chaperone NapD [Gilvimarinus xylanilyticus]MCP8900656.1 chaperone NapD [Gilvimarinus xylanilyticus]